MKTWFGRWGLPVAKGVLALAILYFVGKQFYRDLSHPDLAGRELRYPWMVLSGALYLIAIGLSAVFWVRLMVVFGQKPSWLRAARAYYIGHLGKYVPGKAWALFLRGSLVQSPDVRFGVAGITAFYEVLTTMATGALVAATVFALRPPQVAGLAVHPALTGLLLVGLMGVPLLPGVFNLLVGRMARRFPDVHSFQVPKLRARSLAEGMLLTGVGWVLMGASVWAMLVAVMPEAPELTAGSWADYSATIGLAYVAGFLAVIMPSGVVVREYVLLSLLSMPGNEPHVALGVVLLRLVWTAAEVVVAGAFLAGMAAGRRETVAVGSTVHEQPTLRNEL